MTNGPDSAKPSSSGERRAGHSDRSPVANVAKRNPSPSQGQRAICESARAAAIETLGGDEPLEWDDEDTGVVHLKALANSARLKELADVPPGTAD